MKGLAFLLCLSFFAVASYAWFVNSVKAEATLGSGQLGLKVEEYKLNSAGTDVDGVPSDLGLRDSAGKTVHPLFAVDGWDGSSVTKYIRVENTGDLPIQFDFYLDVADHGLANHIAYSLNWGQPVTDPDSINGTQIAGGFAAAALPTPLPFTANLHDELNDLSGPATFHFNKGESIYFILEYGMAGFTPVGVESLTASFIVGAIQDSASLDNLVFVRNQTELDNALSGPSAEKGSTIVFLNDIAYAGPLTIGEHHNLDLSGFMLTVGGDIKIEVQEGCAMEIANGTIDFTSSTGQFDLSGIGPDVIINLVDLDKDKDENVFQPFETADVLSVDESSYHIIYNQ